MSSSFKKALLVAFIFIIIMAVAWYYGIHNYFTLKSLRANRLDLQDIVQSNYLKAVLIFAAIYVAVIATAIPGVPPLTMIGGFLFGFIPGGIYASIAATVGTTISFLLIRYVLSGIIRGKYAEKLERFNEKIASHGVANYLLTMQLIGVIPFFVINILAALTDVPFKTFVWTTYVGSLPIIFIYAFAGGKLSTVESASDIFSPSVIALFVVLILFTMMPLFLRFSRRVADLE